MKTLRDYSAKGRPLTVPDGTRMFAPGDDSSAFVIVTHGAVRVEQTNSAGRTIVLYRVAAGESCVLTTTCLLSDRPYSGYGYAEGEVKGIAIPPAAFRQLMQSDPAFQALVFQSFAARIGALTDVIDDLLEHRTDLRLARWLATRPDRTLHMTQAEIAQELGTAREVVSRALKAFEARGWITLRRGAITLDAPAALKSHGLSDPM